MGWSRESINDDAAYGCSSVCGVCSPHARREQVGVKTRLQFAPFEMGRDGMEFRRARFTETDDFVVWVEVREEVLLHVRLVQLLER